MAGDDIYTRVTIDTSQAMAASLAYSRSLEKVDAQLARTAAAQERLDAAVAESGASSDKAVAAQSKLEASLRRTQLAQDQSAIAAKRSAEVQTAAADKAAAAQEAASAKQAAALKRVGTVAGSIGAVAAVGLAVAAKKAADFNAQMAQLQALTRGTPQQLQALNKAAFGFSDIGVSASQAADAEIEMVKAGVSVKDILGGGLQGTLQLAAAGQTDVATATEIASAAMVQFGLNGKQIPHIADLLAAGADKSLGSVTDLGEGLKAVGTTAHQAGLSINDTVGALAEFAKAGLTGSLGGTAFKQMLLKMEAPSAKAAGLMQQYGISLYDASGHLVTISALAGELHDKLGGLSEAQRNAALATIFGSRAVQTANILYKNGAQVTQQWVDKVNAQGFAAAQTRGKMDSLNGDLQKFEAQVSNDAIALGEQLQPALRSITQDLTAFSNLIGGLPDPLKAVGTSFAVTVAALGLGTWAFLKMRAAAISLAETLGVLSKAQVETGVTATAMGEREAVAAGETEGAAAVETEGAAVGGVGGVGLAGRFSKGSAAKLGGGLALLLAGDAVSHATSGDHSQVAQVAGGAGAGALKGAGLGLFIGPEGAIVGALAGGLFGAISAGRDRSPGSGAPTSSFAFQGAPVGQRSFTDQSAPTGFAQPINNGGFAVRNVAGVSTENSRAMLGGFSSVATGAATSGADKQTAAFNALLKSAQGARLAVEGLGAGEQKLNKSMADMLGTQAGLTLTIAQSKEATKNLGDVMNKSGTAISTTSVAGATLVENMIDIANAAPKTAEGIDRARQAIIAQAEAAGASTAAAKALANELLHVKSAAAGIPQHVGIKLTIDAGSVFGELDRVKQSLGALGGFHTGVQVGGFAAGGYTGAGGRFEPAGIVHRGEFVVPQPDVNRIGLSNLYAMTNTSRMLQRGFAGGG